MAKKKSTGGDRHAVPTMTIRLPPAVADFLKSVADQEERTHAVVVTRALRLYARENGYVFPPSTAGEKGD